MRDPDAEKPENAREISKRDCGHPAKTLSIGHESNQQQLWSRDNPFRTPSLGGKQALQYTTGCRGAHSKKKTYSVNASGIIGKKNRFYVIIDLHNFFI